MNSTAFSPTRFFLVVFLAASSVALLVEPALGQATEGAPERNWSNTSQLSWVMSKGNSNSNNFSVRNVYKYKWARAELYWEAGVLRATSVDDRFAIGTENDFEIVTPEADVDHSRWYSKVRYLRELNDRFFWYVSYDGSRDEPANINRQLISSGGVGNTWYDREGFLFRTAYGLNYTNEDLDLEGASNFAAYRLFYHLEAGASEGTMFESELTFDGSFDAAADLRVDSLNSVSVAFNDALALQASLRLLYRNIPAFDDIDLQDPESGAAIGKVIVPKKKLDTNVSMSLVINF